MQGIDGTKLQGPVKATYPSSFRQPEAQGDHPGKAKDFLASKIMEGFAASSVIHMKNVISGILNKAVDDEMLPSNVALRIGKIVQKSNGDEQENGKAGADPLSREETRLLLDVADGHYPKDYPLFLLLFRTGLRIGEAFALKWGDIDFNGRFIHVQRGLSRMKIQTPRTGRRVGRYDPATGRYVNGL